MPNIQKKEQIIQKVNTKDGEITINLNLTISIENGQLKLNTESSIPENIKEKPIENKIEKKELLNLIPDEIFNDNLIITKFGQ